MITKVAIMMIMFSCATSPFFIEPAKAPVQPVKQVVEVAEVGKTVPAADISAAVKKAPRLALFTNGRILINWNRTREELIIEAFEKVYRDVNARLANQPYSIRTNR